MPFNHAVVITLHCLESLRWQPALEFGTCQEFLQPWRLPLGSIQTIAESQRNFSLRGSGWWSLVGTPILGAGALTRSKEAAMTTALSLACFVA